MKKAFVFIFFLLISLSPVRAQTYIPFVNNMIVYGANQLDDMSGLQPPSFFRTEIKNDTVIGGFTYYKQYSGTTPVIFSGGIRNDTLNKKVYKYYSGLGVEKLLYDFNLVVGDTVNASSGYGFYDNLISYSSPVATPVIEKAWVTSIDSVLMPYDGLYHRRFNFKAKAIGLDSFLLSEVNSSVYDFMGATRTIFMHSLIEGIGQMNNPISSHSSSNMGYPYNFLFAACCSSIDGVSIISTGGPAGYNAMYCNSLFVGIESNFVTNEINLFPNPTDGKCRISISNTNDSQMEITNVLGKIIYRAKVKSQTIEIDLSDKLSGIYFIRLSDSKGNCVIKKIIKN